MKVRTGFVSNSSSSSFIIAKAYLTKKQIDGIKEWYIEKLANVMEEMKCHEDEAEEHFDEKGANFNETEYYISCNYYYVEPPNWEKLKIDANKILHSDG